MKRSAVFILLFSIGSCAFSQSTNMSTFFHKNVKKADYFFDHFAYRNALELYLHKFEKDSGNYHVRERIAMCYFKLHDPASAELWYSSLAKEPDIHPEAKFEYAEALSMNGKYHESLVWFREYLRDRPNDKIASEKLNFLSSISRYTENELRFIITPTDFNSDRSEYGAHFFHDGVVFASSRDLDLLIKHKPSDGISDDESLLNLYFARRRYTGDWDTFVPFHNDKLRTRFHEGPMAFYDNYRKGAFTQSNVQNGKPVYDANGKINLRIYFAEIAHLGSFEHVAPFDYNHDGYSNAHPSFTPDGKTMYFSSTMPTGHGESDLYYSELVNGRWQQPVNVGDAVNTREDESYPFIANDTTLYFSSNGHGTFGGLDIYVTYKRNGQFSKPINLGAPMNTRFDDFSLVCDSLGRSGFIASNREGGKGHDDIYSYVANFYFLAGEVRELSAEQDRLSNAKILAYNQNGDLIDSTTSDNNGHFTLDLPYDQDFIIRGEKDGFETLEDLAFSTRGKPFGIDSLMLPLWRQRLFAKGRIFSNETQSILPGVSVVLKNLTDGTSDSLHVDENGEYEFLVRPEKKYAIEASKQGYIPNGFNLDTKGILQGDLLNDIVLEEVYIEKELVLFEYDQDDIREDSWKLLNRIVRTLNKFPRATVNIAAHADARGTQEYNNILSKDRATAAQKYLISKGINPKRIQATWFGEELVLNKCSDGVDCAEEEHSQNRRAELKVQREPIE
jgi:outer membrane protein OmpA-like peptidoglycan-associated protein